MNIFELLYSKRNICFQEFAIANLNRNSHRSVHFDKLLKKKINGFNRSLLSRTLHRMHNNFIANCNSLEIKLCNNDFRLIYNLLEIWAAMTARDNNTQPNDNDNNNELNDNITNFHDYLKYTSLKQIVDYFGMDLKSLKSGNPIKVRHSINKQIHGMKKHVYVYPENQNKKKILRKYFDTLRNVLLSHLDIFERHFIDYSAANIEVIDLTIEEDNNSQETEETRN